MPGSLRRSRADSGAGFARDEEEAGGRYVNDIYDLQVFYGSDGTRTRDLRRDRPVLAFRGRAGIGGNFRQERDNSPPALRGLPGTCETFRRPPAGYLRDEALSDLVTRGTLAVNAFQTKRRGDRVPVRRPSLAGTVRGRRAPSPSRCGSRPDPTGILSGEVCARGHPAPQVKMTWPPAAFS
jgi:hypothetical protein